jgi:hypothetical protein
LKGRTKYHVRKNCKNKEKFGVKEKKKGKSKGSAIDFFSSVLKKQDQPKNINATSDFEGAVTERKDEEKKLGDLINFEELQKGVYQERMKKDRAKKNDKRPIKQKEINLLGKKSVL